MRRRHEQRDERGGDRHVDRVVAVVAALDHLRNHRAADRGDVRDRRARDAAEQQARQARSLGRARRARDRRARAANAISRSRDAAVQHQLAREDEQRDRDQRCGVRAGGRLDDQHVGRQAEIEQRRSDARTARLQPTRRARAAPRTHRTGSERHSVGTFAAGLRQSIRSSANSTNSAPPATNGNEFRPDRTARAPGVFRAPSREHQAAPRSRRTRRRCAAVASRAERLEQRAAERARRLHAEREAEMRLVAHADGRREHQRRLQQQQRDGLRPARGRVEHVAREHLPRLDEREQRRARPPAIASAAAASRATGPRGSICRRSRRGRVTMGSRCAPPRRAHAKLAQLRRRAARFQGRADSDRAAAAPPCGTRPCRLARR